MDHAVLRGGGGDGPEYTCTCTEERCLSGEQNYLSDQLSRMADQACIVHTQYSVCFTSSSGSYILHTFYIHSTYILHTLCKDCAHTAYQLIRCAQYLNAFLGVAYLNSVGSSTGAPQYSTELRQLRPSCRHDEVCSANLRNTSEPTVCCISIN